MMNTEMIDLITRLALIVLSALITGYLIPWLKAKMSNEKYAELLTFIRKCVEAAEKIYEPEQWKEKKNYVLNMALDKLDNIGISVSSTELNAIIEGFVKEIKG